MTQKRPLHRIFTAVGCLLLLCVLVLPASAAEGTLDCTYIPITGDGFVADTMNGVEARYNLEGETLYCVELVIRYYQEVYGLEIRCGGGAPVVLNNDDLYFEATDDPKPGDVMYGSAEARGKDYNHWALVKSNNGDTLTLFEQNWSWNGQAGINRVIEYPTEYYEIYTLKSRSGAEIQPVSGSVAVMSDWAEPYIQQAAQDGIANLETDFQTAVTRETFCQMALNVLENYGVVSTADGTACEEAASLGLVSNLNGEAQLTRQEAAVIVARLMDIIGTLPEADLSTLASYEDVDEIADWAGEAVAQLTACGLLSGSEGAFNPQAQMTNEQAVALLVRMDENPSPSVTYHSAAGARSHPAVSAAQSVVALGGGNMMLSRSPLWDLAR